MPWELSFGLSLKLKKLIFEIYIADRKVFRQSFFCSAVLTSQHYHWYAATRFALPRRVASWVNYSSRRTELSSEHFASDLSLLKADAPWCENRRCSDSNLWPMDPKASVLRTTPQRPKGSKYLVSSRRIQLKWYAPHCRILRQPLQTDILTDKQTTGEM